MFWNLIDDSKSVITYYKKQFNTTPGKQRVFNKIIKLMLAWSVIVGSGNITKKEIALFKDALSEKEEGLWFEAGFRLAKLLKHKKSLKKLFEQVFDENKGSGRLNVTALTPYFEKELAESFLRKAINDRNHEVREKALEAIELRQE